MKAKIATLSACLLVTVAIAWMVLQGFGRPTDEPFQQENAANDVQATGERPIRDVPQLEGSTRNPIDFETVLPFATAGLELLQGTVVTALGDPIAQAVVNLQRRDAQSFSFPDLDYWSQAEHVAEQRTGADGTFAFSVPAFRPFALEVRASGYAPAQIVDCYGGQNRTAVLQQGGTIEGFVTRVEDQSPVEGVEVWVGVRRAGIPIVIRSETDARGYYRVGELPPGELDVGIITTFAASPAREFIELQPGQVFRHDVQVENRNAVTGTVADATTGQPIAGAEVADDSMFMRRTYTDFEGRYTLHGVGRLLCVRATGYALHGHMLESSSGSRTADISLVRGGAAEGRIVDPDGEPVSGAYVAAVTNRSEKLGLQLDWRAKRAGEDGLFRIEGLHPEVSYHLLIRQPSFGTLLYAFPASARPESPVEFGDITMLSASSIQGRVVDGAGEGISPVSIELIGANANRLRLLNDNRELRLPQQAGVRAAVSDEDGVFRITDLSPGTYTLNAVAGQSNRNQGMPWTMEPISMPVTILDPGEIIDHIEIIFDMSLKIAGEVRSPTGELSGNLIVALQSQEDLDAPEMATLLENGRTTFEFVGVRPGTYTVGVMTSSSSSSPWIHGRTTDVEAGNTDVEVMLRRIAWIEGVVQDLQGRPAEGITVRAVMPGVRPAGFRPPRVRTGPDGTFRLKVGEGDVVEIHAGPPPKNNFPPDVVINPDPELEVVVPGIAAGTTDLVIRLR